MRWHIGISNHGLGHLAQIAPVINCLAAHQPDLSLHVQSTLPKQHLDEWIVPRYSLSATETDLGIPMHNALEVDVMRCHEAYRAQSSNWEALVKEQIEGLEQSKAEAVLTNNSYLLGEAAARLGLPCWHACSLNWADIYWQYCQHLPDASAVYQLLCRSYNRAKAFFRFTPGMPMPGLTGVQDVGPVGRQAKAVDLKGRLNLPASSRILLVSLGGMPYPVNEIRWPKLPGWCLIGPGLDADPPYRIDSRHLTLPFEQLVASSDALLTKPGYGLFVEAAVHGLPVLSVCRGDWPEEPGLIDWLQHYVPVERLPKEALAQGDLVPTLSALTERTKLQAVKKPLIGGAEELVERFLL